MDIDKLIFSVVKYFSEYFQYFIQTIIKPHIIFTPNIIIFTPNINHNTASEKIILLEKSAYVSFNPRLFGFLVINIIFGFCLISLVKQSDFKNEIFGTVLILIFFWFMYSTVIHIIFKLFKGKANYIDSISVSLQIFGVIYALCSFFTFIWSAFVNVPFVINYLLIPLHIESSNLINEPILIYFIFDLILLLFYIPTSLSKIHMIKFPLVVIPSFIAVIIWLFLNIMIYISSIGPPTPMTPAPPSPKNEQAIIKLNWSNSPRDIDIHLMMIYNDSTYHVFYSNKGNEHVEPWTALNEDIQTGFGPEQISINKIIKAKYHIAVHNFSKERPLNFSGATIEVIIGSKIRKYKCPQVGNGEWWDVFILDGASGELYEINKIVNHIW